MAKRNATPLILSILLIGLIYLLLLYRITHQNIWINFIANFDIIFALVYLAWILIEFKISKEEIYKGNKASDYGTCELYAIGQAAVFCRLYGSLPLGNLQIYSIL